MGNRAVPNYKNSYSLVITLQVSLYPDRTLGERIRKGRLERGLFQRNLARLMGLDEITIVNWEREKTKPSKKNFRRLQKLLGNDQPALMR
jgi:ribosome-binding protein aMBF1 (putative translation factor)